MIGQSLDLSLKQELKINAQLLQTMETLSLSTDELKEKIRKEAETNPVLIIKEKETSYDALASEYRKKTDRRESYQDDAPFFTNDDTESSWMEGMVSEKETLQQHLLGELGLMNLDADTEKTAETLITALDRNGFFPIAPELSVKDDERKFVPAAVKAIQSMEPDGIGVRNWRESLVLQASMKGMKGKELELFSSLVTNELENLKAGKIDLAARNLGTDREEAEALFSFLRTLTPFPGRKYGSEYEQFIVPELSIKKNEEGNLVLTLNKNALPIVEIDPSYSEMEKEYRNDRSESCFRTSSYHFV